MGAIIFLLTTIEVLTALLLIGIVLIQQSKAGGGLTAMGGGMTETVFGAAAGNVLTRGTVMLASVFLAVTLLLAVITGHRGPRRSVAETLADKPVIEKTVPAVDEAAAAVEVDSTVEAVDVTPADGATAPAVDPSSSRTSE